MQLALAVFAGLPIGEDQQRLVGLHPFEPGDDDGLRVEAGLADVDAVDPVLLAFLVRIADDGEVLAAVGQTLPGRFVILFDRQDERGVVVGADFVLVDRGLGTERRPCRGRGSLHDEGGAPHPLGLTGLESGRRNRPAGGRRLLPRLRERRLHVLRLTGRGRSGLRLYRREGCLDVSGRPGRGNGRWSGARRHGGSFKNQRITSPAVSG